MFSQIQIYDNDYRNENKNETEEYEINKSNINLKKMIIKKNRINNKQKLDVCHINDNKKIISNALIQT